jgi:hypothetical protein
MMTSLLDSLDGNSLLSTNDTSQGYRHLRIDNVTVEKLRMGVDNAAKDVKNENRAVTATYLIMWE